MPSDLLEAESVRRSRFILRSLLYFWPIVDYPDDIDRITRLAFSICLMDLLINTVTLLPDLLRPDWRAWTILAVLAVSCFLGANAVRQNSVPAAAMLTAIDASHVPAVFLVGHNRSTLHPRRWDRLALSSSERWIIWNRLAFALGCGGW